jgi:hypothetical protein
MLVVKYVFQGLDIEAVAFNKVEASKLDSTTTGPILFGTKGGDLYEGEISYTEEYFKREDRFVKKVTKLIDVTLFVNYDPDYVFA